MIIGFDVKSGLVCFSRPLGFITIPDSETTRKSLSIVNRDKEETLLAQASANNVRVFMESINRVKMQVPSLLMYPALFAQTRN